MLRTIYSAVTTLIGMPTIDQKEGKKAKDEKNIHFFSLWVHFIMLSDTYKNNLAKSNTFDTHTLTLFKYPKRLHCCPFHISKNMGK